MMSFTVRERLRSLLDYLEQVERLGLKPTTVVPVEHYCAWEEEWVGLPGLELADASGQLGAAPGRSGVARNDSWLRLECPPPGGSAETARARAVYDRLFSLQQSMDDAGAHTPLELVWGAGILLWNHPNGQRIAHPLVSQPVEVRLDRTTLALEVGPRLRAPVFEAGPLVAIRHPALTSLEAEWRAEPQFATGMFSPFDREALGRFLRACARALGPTATLREGDASSSEGCSLPALSETPLLAQSWVIYARRRTPSTLIEDIDRLRRELDNASSISAGAAAFVTEPEALDGPGSTTTTRVDAAQADGVPGTDPAAEITARNVFFPKPFNDEQLSILRKLADSDGVVVQGPPGTGKTHTIANVICHTLAQGGRVLVTAKGESALAVLRSHLPESLQPLAVSLLTDEHAGVAQFQRAVQTIATAVARIDPPALERSIAALDAEASGVSDRLAIVDAGLDRAARAQFRPVAHHGEALSPAALAQWVAAEATRYGWFVDRLPAGFAAPAIDDATIDRVRSIRRSLGPDLLSHLPPGTPEDELSRFRWPETATMASIHGDLSGARALEARMVASGVPVVPLDTPRLMPRLVELSRIVAEALGHLAQIKAGGPVLAGLLVRARRDGHAFFDRLDPLIKASVEIETDREAFAQRPVLVPPEAELDQPFLAALARGRTSGNPIGLLQFGRSPMRAWLQQVSIGGVSPQGQADWAQVERWVALRHRMRLAAARWHELVGDAGEVPASVAEGSAALARACGSLRALVLEVEPGLRDIVAGLLGPAVAQACVGGDRDGLQRLADLLERNLERARGMEGLRLVATLLERMAGASGDLAAETREYLSTVLGAPEMPVGVAMDRWAGLVGRFRAQAERAPLHAELARLTALIAAAGAPRWAETLRRDPVAGHLDPHTPSDWRDAWAWRQAHEYLSLLESGSMLEQLQAERRELAQTLARVRAEAVEQRVWLRLYRNAPPRVTAALQTYLNAIQQLAHATGPRAVRLRAEARTAMMAAHSAVPCWIMPHWRVSETLPAQIGCFDLVIIDEASQSDLSALPSLLRGRKMIIVGDDQQVSPELSEVSEERLAILRTRYLADQPFANQMAPERSIYDLARVAFSHRSVMLREHFRCVRPVIEFARREFYGNDLLPLRVPRPSERLEPALIDCYLPEGIMVGDVNEVEAHAIADEVVRIMADPAMAGRSIGAVSLHGAAQARRILDLLRERVSARDLLDRSFAAGDARTFQGKERDIMLLSMVTDGQWFGRIDDQQSAQVYNVAASRARDRMMLMRSVSAAQLDPYDLRARLIAHFAQPFPQAPVETISLRDACQGPFERTLFDWLAVRGYRVTPKVPAGASVIDLVVEGTGDRRLAIAIDADGAQDLAQWREALAQQRVLERAGWTVWRVFASRLAHEPEHVTADLSCALAALDIEPEARAGV